MKGIAILLVLLLGVGGAFYLLSRPSDTDLVRLEQEIAGAVARGEETLREVTRLLNALRTVKPTILLLDADLDRFRREAERLNGVLGQLEVERPREAEPRGGFIQRRKEVRTEAETFAGGAADLGARAEVVDRFVRETEPQVKRMLAVFGALFARKNELEQAGEPIDAAILLRIDYLQAEIQRKQALARSVFDVGSRDAAQGAVMNQTAAKEIALLIQEAEALAAQLAPR